MFEIKDVNAEAVDIPYVVGHLEIARAQHLSPRDYFQRSHPIWDNEKREDPGSAFCFDHYFRYEFFAYVQPLLTFLYFPFVKSMGVSARTVAVYSVFYASLAWILTGWLAFRMYHRWAAVLAQLFMCSSLFLIIHLKVAYAAWMPSVVLMNLLIYLLWLNDQIPRATTLLLCGSILSLMYLVGWLAIVFGAFIVALYLILTLPHRPRRGLLSLVWIPSGFVITTLLFSIGYSAYYDCSLADIHRAIFEAMFTRFNQAEPTKAFSISQKFAYTFKCMFWDMETFDPHADKYLEGHPAISPIFTLCLVLGVLYALKERTRADKLLLSWIFVVFAFISSVFVFTHRYALLALPALCILAARGCVGLFDDLYLVTKPQVYRFLRVLMLGALGLSILQARTDFFSTYLLHKTPNLEADRHRGQSGLASWIIEHCPADETLVVLNDRISFGSNNFLFYTYGHYYPFIYWTNYVRPRATPEDLRKLEAALFSKYKIIVFAFSGRLFSGPEPDTFWNDWRIFLTLHPNIQPQWVFSYSDRPPSIFLFLLTRPS